VLSAPRSDPSTSGKETLYLLYWRLGGPHGLSGCVLKIPSTGIRSPDSPIRSESLYRLSYSGPQLTAVLKRLGGPHGRSACLWKIPSTGIRSPDSPIRSESLYRLSYSGPQLTAVLKRQPFVFVLGSGNLFLSFVCDKDSLYSVKWKDARVVS
jgi:hypothetical protein